MDRKGRDLKEVSAPKDIDDLRKKVHPRDHRVFFGAFYQERLKGATGLFWRFIPKDEVGDFRDWADIESWIKTIAAGLKMT